MTRRPPIQSIDVIIDLQFIFEIFFLPFRSLNCQICYWKKRSEKYYKKLNFRTGLLILWSLCLANEGNAGWTVPFWLEKMTQSWQNYSVSHSGKEGCHHKDHPNPCIFCQTVQDDYCFVHPWAWTWKINEHKNKTLMNSKVCTPVMTYSSNKEFPGQ